LSEHASLVVTLNIMHPSVFVNIVSN